MVSFFNKLAGQALNKKYDTAGGLYELYNFFRTLSCITHYISTFNQKKQTENAAFGEIDGTV